VHLKDLILLHTALPDWIDDVYVNFRKMVQLSLIFTELMQVQNATLPIEPNMDLVNTVRVRPVWRDEDHQMSVGGVANMNQMEKLFLFPRLLRATFPNCFLLG